MAYCVQIPPRLGGPLPLLPPVFMHRVPYNGQSAESVPRIFVDARCLRDVFAHCPGDNLVVLADEDTDVGSKACENRVRGWRLHGSKRVPLVEREGSKIMIGHPRTAVECANHFRDGGERVLQNEARYATIVLPGVRINFAD
jgi:hypothetical protein